MKICHTGISVLAWNQNKGLKNKIPHRNGRSQFLPTPCCKMVQEQHSTAGRFHWTSQTSHLDLCCSGSCCTCSSYLHGCAATKWRAVLYFTSFLYLGVKDIPSSIALHNLLWVYLEGALRNLGWNSSCIKTLKTPIKQKASKLNTLGREKSFKHFKNKSSNHSWLCFKRTLRCRSGAET